MANQLWQDVEKEVLKNQISAPQDGCKTMALGTLTVIGVYIALINNLFDKNYLLQSFGGRVIIFSPILLFIIAALLFGLGYLPKSVAETFPEGEVIAQDDAETRKRIAKFEMRVRNYLFGGVIVFWGGIILGLFFLIFLS